MLWSVKTPAVLVASVLSELSDAITSVVGDYGLYAVFLLMLIDAVLPAASELVMVYGGALASGAFASAVAWWTIASGPASSTRPRSRRGTLPPRESIRATSSWPV